MERVIITGPTGVIGIALIQELLKHEIEVTAVCRPGSKKIDNLPKSPGIKVVECSLDNILDLRTKLEGTFDIFYHFAWEGTTGTARNDVKLQLNNVQYTLMAVEAAASLGCKKFIGAGSQAEYGRTEEKLAAQTPVFPETGYGIAKLCAGQMSRLLCGRLGMEHIWTRILSVYGCYDNENSVILQTLGALLKGKTPKLTEGKQQWDYLYGKDAGNAMYLLGHKGKNGKIYCIGSGKAYPLRVYIEKIRDMVSPQEILGFGEIPYGEGQVMSLCADITELQRDTGFYPAYTFEQGMKETIKWYKDTMENEESKCADSML